MANLIANTGGGSIQSANTWSVVEASSYNASYSNNITLTATDAVSNAFTPGAITIDAIALNFKNIDRTKSPAGTITMHLSISGGADVTGGTVTYNVANIDCYSAAEGSIVATASCTNWILFKLDNPITLVAATAYTVKAKVSTASSVTLWCANSSAPYGIDLMIRRPSATGAPASVDTLYICGEHGNSATNTITVTMDNTNTTQFCTSILIHSGGVLNLGTTASTAYYLKVGGVIYIIIGGTLNIGSAGSRLPATASATIEFATTANNYAQYGLDVYGGTVNMYGDNSRTFQTYLSANAASGQAVINATSAAGWQTGDYIIVAGTETSGYVASCEFMTVQSVSSNQVTFTGNLANTHNIVTTGVLTKACEVANCSRNILIRGQSVTSTCYFVTRSSAIVVIDSVRFRWIGSNNSASAQGIAIYGDGSSAALNTSPGSVTITNCALTDLCTGSAPAGVYIGADPATGNAITQTINYTYNVATGNYNGTGSLFIAATCGTTVTVDHCWLMAIYYTTGVLIHSMLPTISNLTITGIGGSTPPLTISPTTVNNYSSGTSNMFNWTVHNVQTSALSVANGAPYNWTVTGIRMWSIAGGAMTNLNVTPSNGFSWTFNNCLIDNVQQCINLQATAMYGAITFNNGEFENGTGITGAGGLIVNGTIFRFPGYVLNNCIFGAIVPFNGSNADIYYSAANAVVNIQLNNTTLNSATGHNIYYSSTSNNYTNCIGNGCSIVQQLANGTANYWTQNGMTNNDTADYHTAAPALRITPMNSSTMVSPPIAIPVPAGTYTYGAWFYKSHATTSAISFSSGQYGNIPANTIYGTSTNPVFSMSIWFQTSQAASGNGFWIFGTSVSGSRNVAYFVIYNQTIYATTIGTTNPTNATNCLSPSTTMNDGNWHHLVLTTDGSHNILYVDGVAGTPVATASWTMNGTYPLRLATGLDGYYGSYVGSLDDARWYNRALTPTDVATLYNSGNRTEPALASGLVGWWKFDELTGTVITDSSTTANNGTWTGPPAYSNFGAPDSAIYNGTANSGQLTLLRNCAMGINSNTVLASTTSASNTGWEYISGSATFTNPGIAQFQFSCTGSTGWISVDDFVIGSASQTTGELNYWSFGIPRAEFCAQGAGICSGLIQPQIWLPVNYAY